MHEHNRKARSVLLEHARLKSHEVLSTVEAWPGIVNYQVNRTERCLPGYIPYIGSSYFSPRTRERRILAYALSQNLRPEYGFAKEWARSWHTGNGLDALDRQNRHFAATGRVMMHPFDTGHIPILCGIIRWLVAPESSSCSIYEEVAATNLSKFSFRSLDGRKTADCMTSLRRCWQWFSVKEIEVLEPDFVLCAARDVDSVIRAGLENARVTILSAAFPSLRVINRWYRGRTPAETIKLLKGMFTHQDLERKVAEKGRTLSDIIERDAAYFERMLKRIREQLTTSAA